MDPLSLSKFFRPLHEGLLWISCSEAGCSVSPKVDEAVSEYFTLLAKHEYTPGDGIKNAQDEEIRDRWMESRPCVLHDRQLNICDPAHSPLFLNRDGQTIFLNYQRLNLLHPRPNERLFQLKIASEQEGYSIRATAPHVDPNAEVNIFANNADICIERFKCPNDQEKIYNCTEQVVPFQHYLQHGISSCDQLPSAGQVIPSQLPSEDYLPQFALGTAVLLTLGVICKIALRYFSQKPEVAPLSESEDGNWMLAIESYAIQNILGESYAGMRLALDPGTELPVEIIIAADVSHLTSDHCNSLEKLGWVQQNEPWKFIKEGSPRMALTIESPFC